MSTINSDKQPKKPRNQYVMWNTSSSDDSEDETSFQPSRRRAAKPLRQHDNGESSDGTSSNHLESHSTSIQQFSDSDSSSDDSVVKLRTVKRLKRPLTPTSTSDSSDSGVPIGSRRSVKRTRLFYSSESSSSQYSRDANDSSTESLVSDEVSNSTRVNPARRLRARNLRLANGENSSNSDGRSLIFRLPVAVSESDNESDVVVSSHIVKGRRKPVIDSEDETVLPRDSGRMSRTSPNNDAIQRVNSELNGCVTRSRRRNALSFQENEVNDTINLNNSTSAQYNIRQRRQVVDNDIMSIDAGGQNILSIATQAEDSEDSGLSVANDRRVRGRRIPVVESEDDPDSLSSNLDNNGTFNEGRENEVIRPIESNVINLRTRSIPVNPNNLSENNLIRHYPFRPFSVITQNDDESNNTDSEIRPLILSQRMILEFESDDSSTSSSSISESHDNIPLGHFNHHDRFIPNLESNIVNIKASTSIEVCADEICNENSSDTEGESEKCPICLAGFKLQQIGKPKSCNHKFCFVCITEWAKKSNTCPVDRKLFNSIVVYSQILGKVITELPVENATPQFEGENFNLDNFFISGIMFDVSSEESSWSFGDIDELTLCSGCGLSYVDERIINCDSCSSVYHVECIVRRYGDYPTTPWYCLECQEMTAGSN